MLKKAKMNLVLNHPFFAQIALQMEYIEDKSVGTMSISRKAIKYNPSFVNSLKLEECVGVLAHEVLHYSLGHHARGKNKNHDRWNRACDYVINLILKEIKLFLPQNALYDTKFTGLNAEQVYELLSKEDENNQQQNSDDSDEDGNGSNGDAQQEQDNALPQNWGKVEEPEDGEELETEAEAKENTVQAIEAVKNTGKDVTPALERAVKEMLEPKKSYQELLQKYMAEKARNDYSWTIPNRKYIQMGLYLPSLNNLELGRMAFAIDTSISMDRNKLAQVIVEIKEASKHFNIPVTLIHCDDDIRKIEELDLDSDIVPVGGGFTSFKPVFKWVNENMPDIKALLYFTDGECYDKIQTPDYDVLWIIYGNPTFKWDFGDIIII